MMVRRHVQGITAWILTFSWQASCPRRLGSPTGPVRLARAERLRAAVVATMLLVAPTAATAQVPCSLPPNLVAWWPLNGNANDVVGNNGNLAGGATFGAGVAGQAISLDGTGYVDVPGSNTLAPTAITVAAWKGRECR